MTLDADMIVYRRKCLWAEQHSIDKDKEYRDAAAAYMLNNADIAYQMQQRPELLIETFFVIVDKEQQTVPFFLNVVQRDFINDLSVAIKEFKRGQRLSIKFLVLKGRQQGFTTAITAYQLAYAITHQNFSGVTIADNIDNTNAIFEKKAKYPYANLPDIIKPTEKYNNRKELMFSALNSAWACDTAGKKEVGRSQTLNFFHGSESAFWSSISDIVTGLGEALTKSSIQILESTANGYNEYKDLWDCAGDGGPGTNTWQRMFYQWWRTPEYADDFESNTAAQVFKTKVNDSYGDSDSEQQVMCKLNYLRTVQGLSWGQLYWYYNKWKGYIDKDKILQEYPCTPEEAFLSSGRCVFDKAIIINRIDQLRKVYSTKPPITGRFTYEWNDAEHQDYIKIDTIKFVPCRDGNIKLYQQPIANNPYVIGGDTKGEGKDYYAATCLDNVTGQRVATYHAQLNQSKPFTWQVYCLGIFYNYALIGVEMNFNTAPIEELQRLSYPKQYMRKQYDKVKYIVEERAGWRTDGNTRPLIIDKEISIIEEHIELFTDIQMLQESLTFVYDDNGRPNAESGKHDDILLSDMIANEIRAQQSFMATTAESDRPQKLIEKLEGKKRKSGIRW